MQRAFQHIESIGAASPTQGDHVQSRQDAPSCRPLLNQTPAIVAPGASSGTMCQQVTEVGGVQHDSMPTVRGKHD